MRCVRRKAKRSKDESTAISSSVGSIGSRNTLSCFLNCAARSGRPRIRRIVSSGEFSEATPNGTGLSELSVNRKVSRFRMMNDDSRSRLLRIELKLFRQLNINARRIEQFKQ